MRTRLVVVAVAACAVCAACGSSGGAKVTAQIVGGQPRERALAREILEKLAPSPVSVVRFMGYQHDAIHHWPGRRMDVTGAQTAAGDSWREYIFGYSYALVARERHVPIGFVSFRNLGYGGLDSALAKAPRAPIRGQELHAFEKRLNMAAKTDHASIRFRELRPGPVALEATLTTKRPGPFLEHDLAKFLGRMPRGLFGFLLRVDYPSGKMAFTRGLLPNSADTAWDPRLTGCIGAFVDMMRSPGPPRLCPG